MPLAPPASDDAPTDRAGLAPPAPRDASALGAARGWIVPAIAVTALSLLSAGLLAGFVGIAAPALSLGPALPLLAALFAASFMAVGLRRFAPARVRLGADGVTIWKSGRRAFVPFSEIASVGVTRRQLRLRLHDGSVRWVSGVELDAAGAWVVARQLGEAITAYASAPEARMAAAFERRGRTVLAWRAHVRRLLRGAAGYRSADVSAEACAQVLTSPRASREQRIGAALALVATGETTATAQIRAAAEASTSAPLRFAFERAADGDLDDAVLARALEVRHLPGAR